MYTAENGNPGCLYPTAALIKTPATCPFSVLAIDGYNELFINATDICRGGCLFLLECFFSEDIFECHGHHHRLGFGFCLFPLDHI
jgi:hypothetical protein